MTALKQLPDRDAFSIAEVSVRTGLGRETLYKAIRAGRLEARQIGRRLLVPEGALRRFLQKPAEGGPGGVMTEIPSYR